VCRHWPRLLPGGFHGRANDRLDSVGRCATGLDRPTSTLIAGSHPPVGKTDSTVLSCCDGRGGSDGLGDAIAFALTLTGGTSPRATPRRNPDHRPVGSPDVDARDDDRDVAE